MATYAVGDIQGCLDSLYLLLKQVSFNPGQDHLWVAGDLVNRGPDSLGTMRFIKSLPNTQVVLGNHDLHLLAAARGGKSLSRKDNLSQVLEAADCEELLSWLQTRSLLHHDGKLGYTMVHAGIPPIWTVEEAMERACEVEAVLRGSQADDFFRHMYGNKPDQWQKDLKGNARLRLITNYFTRIRFCDRKGRLELATKTGPDNSPAGFAPWFSHPEHACGKNRILFGHWAALAGVTGSENFIGLDTGCVWGGALTALRLEDGRKFSVKCDRIDKPKSGVS